MELRALLSSERGAAISSIAPPAAEPCFLVRVVPERPPTPKNKSGRLRGLHKGVGSGTVLFHKVNFMVLFDDVGYKPLGLNQFV